MRKNIKNIIKTREETEKLAKETIQNYKKFAIKGNVIDMAIGVTIGTAFTNIVNTLVSSVITPLISLLTKNVDLSKLFISLNGIKYPNIEEAKKSGAIIITYGNLINAVLNFFIISIVLFIVFSYIKKVRNKMDKNNETITKATTKECPYCKNLINIDATRCGFCTSILEERNKEKELKKEINKEINK